MAISETILEGESWKKFPLTSIFTPRNSPNRVSDRSAGMISVTVDFQETFWPKLSTICSFFFPKQ